MSGLIKTGRFDSNSRSCAEGAVRRGDRLADDRQLVRQAQQVFLPVWESTKGNDGYVSFELDPLLEDPHQTCRMKSASRYIELGKKWAAGHKNRMIKVPATPAGLDALEELVAAGVTLNVTLIFSPRQYRPRATPSGAGPQRQQTWTIQERVQHLRRRGWTFTPRRPCRSCRRPRRAGRHRQRQADLGGEPANSGREKKTPLTQEMIFASTGTKKPEDPPWKYVEAFAG